MRIERGAVADVDPSCPPVEQRGRIAADGDKRSMLTSQNLGALFEAPVILDEIDSRYFARSTV